MGRAIVNDEEHAVAPERMEPVPHPIEELPLQERAAAYEHELEQLRGVLDGTDSELDFGA
ncbi:hypothetical protein [Gulosibacter chungangensis]|uniref:Uncharacterized protein n=1 Tax=Gulosibacter chungangensis TaxID=979746 RepID=A0A7J5BCV3_9MICO|nr:hypothetical protein [Gulosibacter chungangensis]KAB1643872.1 hypothetical protein F8O05_03450 [Gulosibacter chungangensis]